MIKENRFIKALKSSSVKDVFAWTKGLRFYLIIISIGDIVFTGVSLWLALVNKDLVDAAVNKNDRAIIGYALLILAIFVFQGVLGYLFSKFSIYIRSKFSINLRAKILNAILSKQYAKIERFHSGELVNRMFSDVTVVADGVMGIFPPLLSLLVQLIGAFVILSSLVGFKFVAILAAVALLASITTLFFRKKSKALHKAVQEEEGKVHAVLQESLQNVRLIKASESEEHIESKTEKNQFSYLKAQMRRAGFVNFASSGLSFVFRLGWLISMTWGCIGISRGLFSYGTLMAITQLVGQIQGPFASMSGLLSRFYNTLSSAERIKELFDLPDEVQTKAEKYDAEKLYGELKEIDFKDVSFSYNRNTVILDNVSFKINKGDFTAVTGLSGGGKSTLFLILLGIYTPTGGDVAFVTGDNRITAGKSTRCLFSYVPQGNALFSGTLKENISMFCENATEEQVKDAARIACIDDFIDTLPDGYDTVIGERGLGLSEGQAQRIAVARAILGNSPILLLDEATSALDENTEAQLLKNISSLKNRTCFIVTHRKAALSICNKRIHLEESKISEIDI